MLILEYMALAECVLGLAVIIWLAYDGLKK